METNKETIPSILPREEEVFIKALEDPRLTEIDPERKEDIARILAVAIMVKEQVDENDSRLDFKIIKSHEEIENTPTVYLFETDEVALDRVDLIDDLDFEIELKALSGKVDAAHAILPGTVEVFFEGYPDEERASIPVVVKGSFKREFDDRMNRLKKDVEFSRIQHQNGEIAFKPIAAVIAPPVAPLSKSRKPQNEILLLTLKEDAVVSMDNSQWNDGFTEENLDAAEKAVAAMGRFNISIGLHGDTKIKNFVQQPDGKTSMIDFETSEKVDVSDAVEARNIVTKDLGLFFANLEEKGFMSVEPWRAFEAVEAICETYLEQWTGQPSEVQEAVYEETVKVAETYIAYAKKNNLHDRYSLAA